MRSPYWGHTLIWWKQKFRLEKNLNHTGNKLHRRVSLPFRDFREENLVQTCSTSSTYWSDFWQNHLFVTAATKSPHQNLSWGSCNKSFSQLEKTWRKRLKTWNMYLKKLEWLKKTTWKQLEKLNLRKIVRITSQRSNFSSSCNNQLFGSF